MLTRIKKGSFSRSILKHNKGINDAKCVNVNWQTTSKPDRSQNEMNIQILYCSHNYYPIYFSAKSTNQIYFMKPHHPKNHNHDSRFKSSRRFQLTPNIQRVLVRIKVTCAPYICSQKIVEGITWNMMTGIKTMLTRIKEGSFSRSILIHNKGINDAKCVNVNWLSTSKPGCSPEWCGHPISLLITQLLSNLLLCQSTNHIYFMKPHHPKNHNHCSRYKSSRLFQLTPNIQRVLVRIKVTCSPDICSQKIVEGITWNMMPGG